jgi:hypothetical protein
MPGLAQLVLGIDAGLDALGEIDFLGRVEQGGTADFVQVVADGIGRNTGLVGVKIRFGRLFGKVSEGRLVKGGLVNGGLVNGGLGNDRLDRIDRFDGLEPGGGTAGGGDGGLLRRTASPVTTLDVWRCSFGSASSVPMK